MSEKAKLFWRSVVRFVKSRPLPFILLAVFAFLWYQDRQAFRLAAKMNAFPRVLMDTKESTKYEKIQLPCDGPIAPSVIAHKFTKSEIKKMAEEAGLILEKTVVVQGDDRIVEVPIFTDNGISVALTGEKKVPNTPWGGKLFLGINIDDGLPYTKLVPFPEPYREKLGVWAFYLGAHGAFDYDLNFDHNKTARERLEIGPEVSVGTDYEWRRFGRWITALNGELKYSIDQSNFEARFGFRLVRRSLPQSLKFEIKEIDL